MIRLAIRCRAEDAERVLAELLELVPGGVEEVGPVGPEGEAGGGDEVVEFAIYGPPGELPELPELEASAGHSLIGISSTEIPDDWADRWRDFHVPISIGNGRLVVRPSWEQRPATSSPPAPGVSGWPKGRPPDESRGIGVIIDPGQAFGTGAHATTRLCLEFLLELADAGEARGPLADLGTGSGVLAIAAAKLGFAPVVGCDSERAALEAAAENAAANGVELELTRVNLRTDPAPRAPTVVANLTAPLLRDVAAGFVRRPPGRLICSGLLAGEADSVTGAFAACGLVASATRFSGDWAGILFATP